MAASTPQRRAGDLVLIGLRASGKTTLGRAVAKRRVRPFIDLDEHVLATMGHPSVADAWRAEGEPAFRAAEAAALGTLLDGSGRVLALGGGAPTAPGAAEILTDARDDERALIVYLRCTPDELRRRLRLIGLGDDRPSLTGANPLDEIEAVFDARDPLYRDLADHVLDNVSSLDEGLNRVLPLWKP